VSQTISWPEGAPNPVLTYTYTPPGGKLQGGEKITAFAGNLVSAAFKKRLLLRSPESLIEVQRPGAQGTAQFMILGSVRFNYVGK
jgi:hypothetical protein